MRNAVPACLSSLFEGGKILPHHMPDYLAEVVKVKCLPNSEVDLDVDVTRLHCVLMRRALAMFDQQKYEEARKILEALMQLDDKHELTLYNLACAEALLGETDKAMMHLNAAVDNGFLDVTHMQADTDLNAVKSLPEFAALVHRMEEKNNKKIALIPLRKVSTEEKAPEIIKKEEEKAPEIISSEEEEEEQFPEIIKKEEEKAPEIIISKEEAQYERELHLLEDMGFTDKQKNIALLIAQKGDLANVITILFG